MLAGLDDGQSLGGNLGGHVLDGVDKRVVDQGLGGLDDL